MNSNKLTAEWQALGEGIQAIINQLRSGESKDQPAKAEAASRIEGFLTALRGLSSAWNDLADALPFRDGTASEQGRFLSQSQFYKPLALALNSYGGRTTTREAIAKVGELLEPRLQETDRDLLNTGGVRWVVNTRFARQVLKEHGLLNPTDAGIWELSDAGKRWASSPSEDLPAPVPPRDPRQGELF